MCAGVGGLGGGWGVGAGLGRAGGGVWIGFEL